VDGSFVEANAAKESRIPREQLAEAAQVHQTVRQYLREVQEQNPGEEPVHEQDQVSTTDDGRTGGAQERQVLGYTAQRWLRDDAQRIGDVQGGPQGLRIQGNERLHAHVRHDVKRRSRPEGLFDELLTNLFHFPPDASEHSDAFFLRPR
jgi:hypothetical protein